MYHNILIRECFIYLQYIALHYPSDTSCKLLKTIKLINILSDSDAESFVYSRCPPLNEPIIEQCLARLVNRISL